MIIKIIYQIQKYENEESNRERNIYKCYNQILKENDYLRYICENIISNKLINHISCNESNSDIYQKKPYHRKQDSRMSLTKNELNLNLSYLGDVNNINISNISNNSYNTVKSKVSRFLFNA